jgi:thiol-disulfide isomerase/thioredoxin
MKKVLLILSTVLILIAATIYADRATRIKTKVPETGTVKVDSPTGPTAGAPAPDFTLKDLQGNDVSLSQFKGKVVLIDFWATWCEPCKVEIPWLIELQQKYGDRGFTVLGIAMDEEGKSVVAPFVQKERWDVNGQKFPMSYPIVIGNDDVANKYGGLYGYPTGFLISRDGKQVLKIEGLRGYDEIAKAIESQL